MDSLLYKIDVFEGPLDLLLTLITKNKLNIYDIPISDLLDQYMEQINIMQESNMDIASEFLDMASRLVHIKSVSLLPKKEEAEELKRELTGQLIEYQQCKLVAENLSQIISFDRITRLPEKIPSDLTYTRTHDVNVLVKAYLNAVGRGKRFLPPSKEKINRIVQRPFVSVSSQVVYILRKLLKKVPVSFSSLFSSKADKSERVAAFLALLELVKHKRVRVEEKESEMYIKLGKKGD
ncbi:MAG: segregation/condensation protein A [Clostridia bacterium]|nr:segregation/condensation protein A [Clostridia bacterium]